MIRSDFLLRQFSQFIQALINLLLKRKDSISFEEQQSYAKIGTSLIGIDGNQLSKMSAESIIEFFTKTDYSVEKLEIAAYLLLLDQQKNPISHKDVIKTLLMYVNEHSDTYSSDREIMIQSLK